jgi:protein-S-isoprenylcysteine O-methyltransferase Ste14
VILGSLIALGGVLSFAKAKTTIDPTQPEKASHLVTSGMFVVTRNPMYLGMVFLCLGGVVYLKSPFSLLGVVAFVLYIQRFQIRPEEAAMRKLFGEQFIEYCVRTRRWL